MELGIRADYEIMIDHQIRITIAEIDRKIDRHVRLRLSGPYCILNGSCAPHRLAGRPLLASSSPELRFFAVIRDVRFQG